MRSLRVSVAAFLLGAAAFAGEAASPGAVQIWNVEPWQTVSAGDFSGANPETKSLKPIDLLATRNGVCSGRVVVTRDGAALKGLKGSVGELTQTGGGGSTGSPHEALSQSKGKRKIAADRIQVRYADLARPEKSHMPPQRYDRLLEVAPAEVAAVAAKPAKGSGGLAFTPKTAAAVAAVPVWVTVRVPADAAPGEYEGTLAIEAEGLAAAPVKVPLKLRVCQWVMPDPKDFQVRTIGWMNPEALAKHYGAELWSERHFALMGQTMERMLELGSRQLTIDVGQYFSARDNADTMIKWVKQPDLPAEASAKAGGSYKYDFTLFDRYCDLAQRKIGKPFPVRLNLWRGPKNGGGGEKDDYPNTKVLLLDPASGAVSELEGPKKLGSEEMKAFWKPVMDEIRTRLEKRGWMDVTGPNWMCYCGGMTKEMASMMKAIWPDVRGLDVTHGRQLSYKTLDGGTVPVFVQSTVWNEGSLDPYKKWSSGPYPRQYAGKFRPDTAHCTHARLQYRERSWPTLWTLRTKHEEAMFKGNQGLECVGADHFPIKDAKGRHRAGDWGAFAQGPNGATLAILGAGDAGPVGTERFEAMREGIQLCEAMVFIQKAIEAKKLPGEIEAKANKVLDDRAKAMVAAIKEAGAESVRVWNPAAYADGAARRDGELFAMAAEVARATGGK